MQGKKKKEKNSEQVVMYRMFSHYYINTEVLHTMFSGYMTQIEICLYACLYVCVIVCLYLCESKHINVSNWRTEKRPATPNFGHNCVSINACFLLSLSNISNNFQ